MNRVLAVRGQVVPATATPVVLHAALRDGSLVEGQSRIARTSGIDRVWLSPENVARLRGCPRGDRRGGRHRHRPGQPLHEHPAEPPPARHPPGPRGLVGPPDLRLQRRHAVRRDRGLRPRRPRRGPRAAHGGRDRGHRPGQQPDHRHGASAGRRESVRLRWPPTGPRPARLVLDDIVDPASPIHHDPERLAAAILRIAEREGAARRRNGVARTA